MRPGRPAAGWLLALLLSMGCGADRSAEETVRLYFASLGRDPIRSSALTSAAFQAAHGLRFGTTAGAAEAERRAADASRAPAVQGSAADSRGEEEVIWLATQMKPGFRERARALAVTIEEVRPLEDTVEVTARVRPAAAPAFQQRFWLSRDRAGHFRIDRIAQEGVEPASYADAFVAAPSEASRQRLARAIGAPGG